MLDIEWSFYNICVAVVAGFMISGWLIPLGIKINYGKLKSSITNLQFNPKLAWFLFQVPNLAWVFYFTFIVGDRISIGFALFIVHYINRDILYPLLMSTKTKVPLQIMISAMLYTTANGYLQSISNKNAYKKENFYLFLSYLGVLVFFLGFFINIKSDYILRREKAKLSDNASKQQKQEGTVEKQSKVDKKNKSYANIDQFLFKYVSSPHYFGQIIEWFGYFLVCQNFQSFLFAFSTLNILVAAAIPKNQWDKKNIEGFNQNKKAVIPFLI